MPATDTATAEQLVAQATQGRGCRPSGRPTERVYSDPVQRHLKALLEDPLIGAPDIARAAGVNQTTIRNVPKLRALQRWSAEAILAVTPEAARAARVMLDVTPAREHLLKLMESEDCTAAAITAASGMDDRQIDQILSGLRSKIHPDTERILLSLDPYVVRRNAGLVSPRRAITRLRALQANGHSTYALGLRLGYVKAPHYLGTNWSGQRITQDQDRKIEALYIEIGDQPGPSYRAARIARRLGYYPPIHYDEEMRLIPGSIPSSHWTPLTAPEDRARNKLRMLGLTLREFSGQEIADRIGVSPKTVERARGEIGIRLDRNAMESIFFPFIRPGQDALLELIRQHTNGIDLNESVTVLDDADLDYVAMWNSLRVAAAELRTAPEQDLAVA